MWWLIFPILIVVFLFMIIMRALLFNPKVEKKAKCVNHEFDREKVVRDFQELIRFRTISSRNAAQTDISEFIKLQERLPSMFPNVYKACSLEHVLETGLLFKWTGKSSKEPVVLMAHYDVVTVNESQWDKPAFDAVIEDGILWGRGTLDTKGTFLGILEAADNLIAKGFIPKNDIYFSFAGDEEIAGPTCPAIVEVLNQKGIKPALVIDEGGAVVEDIFPGVKQPCALVGVGEKGMMDLRLKMKSAGGHASAPPRHTIIGQLSQAVVNIENHPFDSQMTPPVKEMFDTLGRHSSFAYKLIFANLWCFQPLLNMLCIKKGGELNALMRTTVAFTMAEGSTAPNVLPPDASYVANIRLIGTDTYESARDQLKARAKNEKIDFEIIHGMNPSIFSSTDCQGWDILKNAISQTWPDAIISPYLMVACSDSRHFCRISDKVYRFSAMALSKEERSYIHGNNERIPLESEYKTVAFYLRIIFQC
jgi:carboxypeptidase PM20D1